MSILWTATGTRSSTISPNPDTRHDVAWTASPTVTLTGGQKRLKSNVNSYALGAQEQTSCPRTVEARNVTTARMAWSTVVVEVMNELDGEVLIV